MERNLNIAPLNGGFMIVSIFGTIISAVYVFPRNMSWGFTMALIFVIMFVASMISMTYGPDEAMMHIKDRKKP